MSLCSVCKIEKDPSLFSADRRRNSGKQSRCKACAAVHASIWSKNNPDKKAETQLKCKYGITSEIRQFMLDKQSGTCAFCASIFTNTPYVDHKKGTKIVRRLLCSNCNTAYGLVQENTETLRRMLIASEKEHG